jgi:riboflavin transporter FmnP
MGSQGSWGRLDTTSVAGIAIFSSLAVILAAVSQALGLNFPLIPYLQFDLGEVAIVLAFFIFGPAPAFLASFVEGGALEVFGQNLPFGPILKLFALLSTVAGLWIGTWITSGGGGTTLGRVVGSSFLAGSAIRAAAMTVANYYLILFVYTLAGVSFLKGTFALFGITMTDANALALILAFSAVFNVLQLAFVTALSYFVLRVPMVSQVKVGGRSPWFTLVLRSKGAPTPDQVR